MEDGGVGGGTREEGEIGKEEHRQGRHQTSQSRQMTAEMPLVLRDCVEGQAKMKQDFAPHVPPYGRKQ